MADNRISLGASKTKIANNHWKDQEKEHIQNRVGKEQTQVCEEHLQEDK